MKKLLSVLFIFTAFVFSSCSSDDENVFSYENTFNGNLLLSGSVISEGLECKVSITDNVAEITLCGASFAPGMMPAMNIVIPSLECVQTATGFAIYGENIVPFVNGEQNSRYTFTEVNAVIDAARFNLSAKMPMGTIGFTTEDSSPSEPTVGGTSFSGTMTVGTFEDDAVIDIYPNYETSLLTIVINDVRFSSGMLNEIDIKVTDIPFSVIDDGSLSFAVNDLLPYIGNEPEPSPGHRFAIFEGYIENGSKFNLYAQMADDLEHSYLAGMSFNFEGNKIIE